MLHPLFKKKYVAKSFPTADISSLEQKIIAKLTAIKLNSISTAVTNTRPQDDDAVCFFFGAGSHQEELADDSKMLLSKYFAENNKDISLLMDPKYEKIKELFLRYNTKLLSSASCERLFSMAKHVLTATRTNLKDERFEKFVILKISQKRQKS